MAPGSRDGVKERRPGTPGRIRRELTPMRLLRRLAPLLSLLLVALVAVQSLDLVACADEGEAATHADGSHVDGGVTAGAHPVPSPGDDHGGAVPHEEAPGAADCLCHVVFTRTERLPQVAAAPAAEPAVYAAFVERVGSVHAKPLDHVPLI